jgi:hypothetical protein
MTEATEKIDQILTNERNLQQRRKDDYDRLRTNQCSFLEKRMRSLLQHPISEGEFISYEWEYYPDNCQNVRDFFNEHNNLPGGRIKFNMLHSKSGLNRINVRLNLNTNTLTYNLSSD